MYCELFLKFVAQFNSSGSLIISSGSGEAPASVQKNTAIYCANDHYLIDGARYERRPFPTKHER